MEGNYPLNLSQRGFSREGVARLPSRERQQNTPEVRKKLPSKPGLSVSGQNFFSQSQTFDSSSSTDDLMLGSLNIAVDETAFVSTTKADLLQLQEEINKMDIDGKIRNSNPSSILKKNHTYSMARFLSKFSNQNIKTMIDKRLNHASTFDTNDLLKFMGVTSESEGVRKLFKMLGIFDLMLLKLTEFHTVAFLKYDQLFESLRKQFGGQPQAKLSSMDAGLTISRFQVDLANMERYFELFSYITKLSQQNKTLDSRNNLDEKINPLKDVNSVEELCNRLRSGESLGFNGELAESLLKIVYKLSEAKAKENSLEKRIKTLEKELNEKSSKLTTMVEFTANDNKNDEVTRKFQERIEQLQDEAESVRKELEAKFAKEMRTRENELKEKNRKLEYEAELKEDQIKRLQNEVEELNKAKYALPTTTQATPSKDEVFNADYYIKMIKQIEDNFSTKTSDLENENYKKGQENVNLRAKLETAERERDDYMSRLALAEKQAEKDARLRMQGGEDSSFEAALREQFTAMKEGFENKIKNLTAEIQQTKKEKSLEVLEIKKELTREKENRELLLRKLQIYTKN